MRGLHSIVLLALFALVGSTFAQKKTAKEIAEDGKDFSENAKEAGQGDRRQIEFMHPETVYSFRGLDGKGFLQRKPINIPEPVYDREGTGLVALIFSINPQGLVEDIILEPGQDEFATFKQIRAAKEAVSQWRFNTLPKKMPQENQQVRVLIQFNYEGSNRVYSTEGNFILEGITDRYPTFIPSPEYNMQQEGVVTAEVVVEPSGEVAWVDRYYGKTPSQPVNPHLGIITHEAIQRWRFIPLPESMAQEQKRVKVTCRYFHWPDFDAATARKSGKEGR